MINRPIKFFLLFLLGVIFLVVSYLAINADMRRYVFTRIVPAYNLYQIVSIRQHVRSRDFPVVADKLISYIDLAKKFSSGKSQMLLGVYDAVDLAASKAITQDDFNELENVFNELVNIDPSLYKARVWLARSISDSSYEDALKHIDKAIEISPVQDIAYREAIRISQKTNNVQLARQYCTRYLKSQFGGELPRNYRNFFGGTSIRNFSIQLTPSTEGNKFYLNSGIQLDDDIEYEFIPVKPVDINGMNLLFSLPSGTIAKISNISFYSNKGVKVIPAVEFSVSSSDAYILEGEENKLKLLLGENDEEIIRLRYKSSIYSVSKIVVKINFSRLPFSNICQTKR